MNTKEIDFNDCLTYNHEPIHDPIDDPIDDPSDYLQLHSSNEFNCQITNEPVQYHSTMPSQSYYTAKSFELLTNTDISSTNGEMGVSMPFLEDKHLHPETSCTDFTRGMNQDHRGVYHSPSTSNGISGKTRIRWTQDLHDKFVECVIVLGGAEKATPKAILKLMDTEGLTIFHIKSHLQKYRIAKYMPDSSDGRNDKRVLMNGASQMDMPNGAQIREVLKLQLAVQRHLHEQLEVQRNLQLRIEDQSRQLRMMFDQQLNSGNHLINNQRNHQDAPIFCLEDFESEESSYKHFHSKIS